MDSRQRKQLTELRERLAILDGVIAEFERLEAIRKRKRKTYSAGGSALRRFTNGPRSTGRAFAKQSERGD
jgi:hypothetical protein